MMNSSAYQLRLPVKAGILIPISVLLFQCIFMGATRADDLQSPAPVQDGQAPFQPQPLPPLSGALEMPADLAQAEAALGRNLTRDYERYQGMYPEGSNGKLAFSEYLYDQSIQRRRSGIFLLTIATPIAAISMVAGILLLYQHAKADGDGYCSLGGGIDVEDDCDEDDGEIIGIILVATFGGIATLAMFFPGLAKLIKYHRRIRNLEPIVKKPISNSPRVSFFYGVGPKHISAGFRF